MDARKTRKTIVWVGFISCLVSFLGCFLDDEFTMASTIWFFGTAWFLGILSAKRVLRGEAHVKNVIAKNEIWS